MQDNKEIANGFLEALWAGDTEGALSLCAPGAVWEFMPTVHSPRITSIPDAIEWYRNLVTFFDPDSGYDTEVFNIIAEGDEVAMEYNAIGKTISGGNYENFYLVRFTVREGKIFSVRPYFDPEYLSKSESGEIGKNL